MRIALEILALINKSPNYYSELQRVPKEMSKKKLFDADEDDAGGGLNINKDYADRYENWRRLEEMQKCTPACACLYTAYV